MATGGMGVGVLPSAMVWPRWVEAADLAAGDVLEFVQGGRHPGEKL